MFFPPALHTEYFILYMWKTVLENLCMSATLVIVNRKIPLNSLGHFLELKVISESFFNLTQGQLRRYTQCHS